MRVSYLAFGFSVFVFAPLTLGQQAPDPQSKLCYLLDDAPGAASLQTKVNSTRYQHDLSWITGEAFSRKQPGKQCGFCVRGLPNPAGGTQPPFLVIKIIAHDSRDGALWSEYVDVKWGARQPNSTSFGDGPALAYKDAYGVLISFPVANYRVDVEAAPSHETAARTFATHLDRTLRSQPPPTCGGGSAGNCDVASIKPAELTSPSSADLKDETVRFTWSPGNLIRDYQLSVDVNPGGAGLGNIGPGKITSAGVKMPDRETPIYVTLRSFPQCGGGPPLPKSYTFRYPGPPSIK